MNESKVPTARPECQNARPVNELRFENQVVIVTGGCRGIGRGIAQRFADAGANVVICCRHEPEDLPAGWLFVEADVREPEQVDTVVNAARERFGRVDVLVNNAGGAPPADTATASPRFTAGIIGLNLTSALVFAQRANAVMQEQDEGGSIINIASVSGVRASPSASVASTSSSTTPAARRPPTPRRRRHDSPSGSSP